MNLTRECLAWAREIGEALSELPCATAGLTDGDAGLALFFAYLAHATKDARHADQAEARLARAIDAAGEQNPFLFSGVVGIAWVTEHLCGTLLAPNEEDVNAEADAFIDAHLDHPDFWLQRWELMYGVAGFGIYLLERPDSPERARLLAKAVTALERAARRDATTGEVAWSSTTDPSYAAGAENLGLAHGASGVIVFLSRLVAADLVRARAEPLLRASVLHLREQRLTGAASCYPSLAGHTTPSRLSWCYGDLCVAMALGAAGAALAEPSWTAEATDIALHAATRDQRAAMVVDLGLCHGAVGLAWMFHRLAAALAAPQLEAASARWLAQAFAMRATDRGIAGIQSYRMPDGVWTDEPGLLAGAAGVGMCLLELAGAITPAWGRVFAVR